MNVILCGHAWSQFPARMTTNPTPPPLLHGLENLKKLLQESLDNHRTCSDEQQTQKAKQSLIPRVSRAELLDQAITSSVAVEGASRAREAKQLQQVCECVILQHDIRPTNHWHSALLNHLSKIAEDTHQERMRFLKENFHGPLNKD